MNDNPNNHADPRLSVVEHVLAAFPYLWQERRDFLALVSVPVIVPTLVITAIYLINPDLVISMDPESGKLRIGSGVFIGLLFKLVFFLIFAVAWHRRILLPDETPTVLEALWWRSEMGAYLFKGLALFAVILPGFMVLPGLGGIFLGGQAGNLIGLLAGYLLSAYIYGRLCMWQIASTVGVNPVLAKVWNSTSPYGVQVLFLAVVSHIFLLGLPLAANFLFGQLATDAQTLENVSLFLILTVIGNLAEFIGLALGIAAFSFAYLDWKNLTAESDRTE